MIHLLLYKLANAQTEGNGSGSRITICFFCFAPIFVIAVCTVAWRPFLIPYYFKFVKFVVSEVVNDHQRFADNDWHLAEKEWRYYQMETRFGQDWCKENTTPRGDVTWLTVMINDDFVVPALVLGYSIRTFSCQKNMIAFISENVSEGTRKTLQSVGWDTRLVEEMDCNWMDAKVGGDRNGGFFLTSRKTLQPRLVPDPVCSILVSMQDSWCFVQIPNFTRES